MSEPINNTVDMFFKNRELPYEQGIRIGDAVKVYPDTFVAAGENDDLFEITALSVTPIYVTLSGGASNADAVPNGAFWVKLPTGCCLFGTKWISGESKLYG